MSGQIIDVDHGQDIVVKTQLSLVKKQDTLRCTA